MNTRRGFLGLLASMPFVGSIFVSQEPVVSSASYNFVPGDAGAYVKPVPSIKYAHELVFCSTQECKDAIEKYSIFVHCTFFLPADKPLEIDVRGKIFLNCCFVNVCLANPSAIERCIIWLERRNPLSGYTVG